MSLYIRFFPVENVFQVTYTMIMVSTQRLQTSTSLEDSKEDFLYTFNIQNGAYSIITFIEILAVSNALKTFHRNIQNVSVFYQLQKDGRLPLFFSEELEGALLGLGNLLLDI